MENLGYAAAVLMGIALGITGGGGSILTVPIFVYLFNFEPLRATHYSLFAVGLTALIGGITYYRRKETDLKTALFFALPSFAGVFLVRFYLLPLMPENLLTLGSIVLTKSVLIMMSFAFLMLFASIAMIRSKTVNPSTSKLNPILTTLIRGFFVGCVTGFVGAGGGFLIVPALVLFLGLKMRMAIGTSLVIIAANSIIGFLSGLKHQTEVDWTFLIIFSSISVLGTLVGSFLAEKVPQTLLKKGFGYFVLVVGLLVLFDQFRKF